MSADRRNGVLQRAGMRARRATIATQHPALNPCPCAAPHFSSRSRCSPATEFPEAGEWFVVLRGRSTFSGVSVLATALPDQPDLIVWRDEIVPYLDEAEFSAEDCEVQEGTIEAGAHTLLRFDTETPTLAAPIS